MVSKRYEISLGGLTLHIASDEPQELINAAIELITKTAAQAPRPIMAPDSFVSRTNTDVQQVELLTNTYQAAHVCITVAFALAKELAASQTKSSMHQERLVSITHLIDAITEQNVCPS